MVVASNMHHSSKQAAAWAHNHGPPNENVGPNAGNDSTVSAVEMCNGFPIIVLTTSPLCKYKIPARLHLLSVKIQELNLYDI